MTKGRKLRSRKAGLPPGSLVHIGDVKTRRHGFSVIDFDESGLAETELASAAQLIDQPRPFATRWANAYGPPSPEDLALLGKTFGLHPLVQEDILNNAQRQKVDSYDDYLYLVLHRYEFDAKALSVAQDQISLVIGRDHLLSFQERPSKTFEPVRQRLRSGQGGLRRGGADTLAHALIDAIVDSYFGVVEQLDDHAEKLETKILDQPKPSTLEEIHQFKRCVSSLRRNLYPLREVLGTLHRDASGFFRPELQLYLRDVYDHTLHVLESLEDLRDQASGLLDAYMTMVSHHVNLEVRTLTVVATVFMPASLIAGIFGMNFQHIPWLADASGFAYAMGLMGGIAALMLIIFRRRKFF